MHWVFWVQMMVNHSVFGSPNRAFGSPNGFQQPVSHANRCQECRLMTSDLPKNGPQTSPNFNNKFWYWYHGVTKISCSTKKLDQQLLLSVVYWYNLSLDPTMDSRDVNSPHPRTPISAGEEESRRSPEDLQIEFSTQWIQSLKKNHNIWCQQYQINSILTAY